MEEPGPPGGLSQDQGKDKQEGVRKKLVTLLPQLRPQDKCCAVLDSSLRVSGGAVGDPIPCQLLYSIATHLPQRRHLASRF